MPSLDYLGKLSGSEQVLTWKKVARRSMRRLFGVDIRSVQPFDEEFETLCAMLRTIGTPLVVDIGANRGGFGRTLYGGGFTGRILSFEPLPDAHEELVKVAARTNLGWSVAPAVAISESSGDAAFHIAGNSSSSSLMEMDDLHRTIAPLSAPVRTINVAMATLDEALAAAGISGSEPLFLKIDTQGSEGRVLDGAERTLSQVIGMRVEMSFASLYQGQPLFADLYARITALRFTPWDVTPVLRDPLTGRILQCDMTFMRI